MPKKKLFKKKSLKIDEAFEKFISYSASKSLSERTLEYYRNNFERFESFLEEREIEKISEINAEVIQKFRLHLKNEIANNTSVNTILRAIRSFLYYNMKMDYIDSFKVEMLKSEEKIKETYTKYELELLLQKPDLKECGFAEYRNWVLINWFLGTGNRAGTVRNIKIRDLDFENGYVRLRKTKTKKQRIIPLNSQLMQVIKEYLEFREGEEQDYLFCTIYGSKLSSAGFNTAITRYNKRRGVEKTSTHLFRHTFAKLWIKNGGDVFRLQKILGHSSMEMVREYVNMFGEDLKENFEQFNPLNQFTKQDKSAIKMEK